MKVKKLKEAYSSKKAIHDAIRREINDKLSKALDDAFNHLDDSTPEFAWYNYDWADKDYYATSQMGIFSLSDDIANDLTMYAPDGVNESIKKTNKKSLLEAQWRKTLKSGDALRKAIDSGNLVKLKAALTACYKEINSLMPDDFDENDLEDKLTDFEFLDLDDDAEDDWDYELSDFYDLCDALRIWVGGL